MDKKVIRFKANFSPEITASHMDTIAFQWAGKDEDGRFVMYNNWGQVIEKEGEMFIEWNGREYPAYYFLHCNHLDGDISMDHVRVSHRHDSSQS